MTKSRLVNMTKEDWISTNEQVKENRGHNFSLTQWLNNHFGCDVDKMMRGDPVEIEKNRIHLEKKNEEVRKEIES